MIMKGCVQWNPVYDWKDLRLWRGSKPGLLDHLASAYPLSSLSYKGIVDFGVFTQINRSPVQHLDLKKKFKTIVG